jgi:agmatinase
MSSDAITKHPALWSNPYGQFLESASSPEGVKNILFGVPLDVTTSFRPGTRQGPRDIRFHSYNLENYSVEQGKELQPNSFYDAGDLDFAFGNVRDSLDMCADFVDAIIAQGKRPIAMGGEHLVTGGLMRGVARHYPDAAILHVDAHFDLREEYYGEELSHATALRLAWKALGRDDNERPEDGPHMVQIGIRSGPKSEADFVRGRIPQFTPDGVADLRRFIEELAETWKGRPVYCSFDIDAVDPAHAPGTGTPEAGGLSSREALALMRMLPKFNLIGFDLVELNPTIDAGGITGNLAAKMIRELLIALG